MNELRSGAVLQGGKYRIEQDFRLADDEAIYGLGQLRDVYMNQRGRQNIELWNHNTYIAIPYFTSEKGYGLYWDNAGKTYFNDVVASKDNGNQPSCTSFTSEVGTCADYYFMYKDGTQDGVIASIRELTGQATMFPKCRASVFLLSNSTSCVKSKSPFTYWA